jgi:7-keto-8-aminopelargonate synthetase-like enzyme
VVDESHSLGVLGNNGCGIFLYYPIKISNENHGCFTGKAIGITGVLLRLINCSLIKY